MQLLIELSKENIELSKQEFLNLSGIKKYSLIKNILIIDLINRKSNLKRFSRLAYTKNIYTILFSTSSLKKTIEKTVDFSWDKVYKTSFCFRLFNHNMTRNKDNNLVEKELAGIIYDNIKNMSSNCPSVNLKKPETLFAFHILEKEIFATRLLYTNNDDFKSRKNNKLPEGMPISLDPKLARAMINLTGISTGQITDPMCGTGGILIEALLSGIGAQGQDIDKIMINRSKFNLDHIKKMNKITKNITLKQQDFFKSTKRFNYIVTDLPFGKNTRNIDENFYNNFFDHLSKILKKTAVIGLPDFKDRKSFYKIPNDLLIKHAFTIYIHSTLSKKIIVLEKEITKKNK